jgi:hypothetical protein
MVGGYGSHCALQASDCPSDSQWVAARLLPGGRAHGGACKQRTATETRATLGLCMDAGNTTVTTCASSASMCAESESFVAASEGNGCTMKENGEEGSPTLFGSCSDGGCYWSSDDCTFAEEFKPPHFGQQDSCICEQVRVGACLFQDHYWCAVSESACGLNAEWISARSLADRSNEDGDIPECFLCREESVPLSPTSVPPTVRPTSAPITLMPPVSNAGGLGSLMDESNSGGTTSALLVGGILGILIVAVGMTAFVVCRQSRRNAKAIPGLNEPSIIISIPSIPVDPSEPLSDDEL